MKNSVKSLMFMHTCKHYILILVWEKAIGLLLGFVLINR